MAQQTINTGTTANDGTGDTVRASFEKVNANFDEAYGGSLPYATSSQGSLADTALQPASIGATVQGYSAVLDATTASFLAADRTKLDGIEALADVTDTASVEAAGALMDSEVTNLAAVKAFDPANYATSAQGNTADSALQSLADDSTPQLGGDLDAQGNAIGGFIAEVVTGVSGTLVAATHSGKLLITSGNVTVPTTTGFTCQIEAGGAHTVTFNGTTSAAMAAGDLMTILVTSPTTIRAGKIAVADQVEFT